MAYHSAGISDPGTIAKQSREVIAFLSDAVDSEKNPYGKLLKNDIVQRNTLGVLLNYLSTKKRYEILT